MPTANERKGLWFLAFVAISGTGVRLWRASEPPVSVAETAALARQIGRVDSARATRQTKRGRREARAATAAMAARVADATADTARPAEAVDLDRADAGAIESLPGVGPTLAKRILAFRDSAGQFGGMMTFCEVRGVGPALVERLRPLVTFNGARSPLSDACGDASKKPKKARVTHSPQPR